MEILAKIALFTGVVQDEYGSATLWGNMRGTCSSWMKGFDLAVTKISIKGKSPYPPGQSDMFLPGGVENLALPDFSRKFPQVRKLKLSSFSLSPTDLDNLQDAWKLESLFLHGCDGLSWRTFCGLHNTPLSTLDLCSSLVNEEVMRSVKYLPLTSLGLDSVWSDLGYCKNGVFGNVFAELSGLTGSIFAELSGMSLLQELDISGDCTSKLGPALKELQSFSALNNLILQDSSVNLSLGAIDAMRSLPLTILDVTDCEYSRGCIGDVHLLGLRGVPLNTLLMWGCRGITDEGLRALNGMPLTNLVLDSHEITSEGILALQGLPLTRLRLFMCGELNDECMKAFVGMPLTDLNFGRFNEACLGHKMTDLGLQFLWDLPLLSLDLSRCEKVTAAGCAELRCRGMPLQKLVLPVYRGDVYPFDTVDCTTPEGMRDVVHNMNYSSPSLTYVSRSLTF